MRAVIFDLDGTLTDTEHLWDLVRREMAVEDGITWPEEASRAMMGMSTQEWSAYMAEVIGFAGTAEDSARRSIEGMQEHYRRGLPVLPGALQAVRRMHAHWPVGLASSSPRVLIDAAVAELGLADVFATTLSTEELGGAGKPAPDVYLEACRRLGVEPAQAVAVEDAHNGILAAKAAGMAVIAVPPHFNPPPASTLALADAVLTDLDELTVALVESLIAAPPA
ncbi:HAD superfamily hydrolase (TIGR01509 family) [Propionicimonas paludicola]|uniref:HAD superfamily hydrolase (TIGR01509 family) n=1 Tax=Propionicimonas paludicola TaxID=185243 RepID=A0A2A9CPU1_9ACTN|nr:HAD family phosphatase [Propionicimonas paludicola]PFG15680.1 HAD superfamily hydrolase (TIGR01509 family) [Propionicimonas paludicola]